MRRRRLWSGAAVFAAMFAAMLPAAARAAATGWIGDQHAAARLITATSATGAATTVEAGLEIRLAAGWHAYWRTPGDAGIPPSIEWTGSENLERASVAWPAPSRYSLQGFETAGYRDHVVLPVALTPVRPDQPLKLHAAVDYAACAEICVPYSAKFDLTLPAGPAAASPEAGLIAAARGRVPRGSAAAGIALVSANITSGDRTASLVIRLNSNGGAFVAPDIFVEGLAKGSPGRPEAELSQSSKAARLTVPLRDAHAAAIIGKPLVLTVVDGARAAQFAATPMPGAPPGAAHRLLPILAIALIGGLLLNAMPCVLPVLSLKLFSVASQAGAERRRVRVGFLLTASGIIASFAVIAAMLVALQASGAAVGWGIQFQWPWFIAAMAAVTTVFAASLWGWLPIMLPRFAYEAAADLRPKSARADAFLTGAFATLLATPCSAPFVGTAVGFALAGGPAEIATVFAALGTGMASPYLAAAAIPELARLLPRPGRWMHALRVVMGLALAATAIWLLSILAVLCGVRVALMTATALILVVVVLALKSWRVIPIGATRLASTTAAALVAAAILWPAFAGVAAPGEVRNAGRWQLLDPGAIRRLVGEGKIVFVDVTAAWCLTCKVNEAAVLDRDPVASRLFGPGVVAMRGDWTRPDPELTRYLESFGRYGIPFNVVYGPGRPLGELLPELLSAGAVERALNDARAPG